LQLIHHPLCFEIAPSPSDLDYDYLTRMKQSHLQITPI